LFLQISILPFVHSF